MHSVLSAFSRKNLNVTPYLDKMHLKAVCLIEEIPPPRFFEADKLRCSNLWKENEKEVNHALYESILLKGSIISHGSYKL